jgi:hypothetical protein
MVFTIGVWVVLVLLDVVMLSALDGEVGSVLEVVEETVGSGVLEGSADVVGSAGVEEDEVEVVGIGSEEVVASSEDEELDEVVEVVGVVSGASEVDVEEVVRSLTMLGTPALWAATAVNSRAWRKNERLDRRMAGKRM